MLPRCSGHPSIPGRLRECLYIVVLFFFQAEDGIRDVAVTGVQTCALPIFQVFDGEGTFIREIRIDVPYDKSAQPAIGAVPDLVKLEAAGAPLTMAPGAPWTDRKSVV